MSSKTSIGRHRAAKVSSNRLSAISKAVSSNAGSFGRQAAVVAVATGLVTSIGLPALAANNDSAAAPDGSSNRTSSDTVQVVSAAKNLQLKFEQPAASSAVEVNEIAAQSQQIEPSQPVASRKSAPAQAAPAATKEAVVAQAGASTGNLSDIVAYAYSGIGHSYVYGGTSPVTGWDCSGFVQWAYTQAKISMPRTNQWVGMVQTSTPKPGDLVVQNGGSHVAIYVGNGMEIGALNPSAGTLLTSVSAVGSAVFYTMP